MSAIFTEDTYEQAIIELFENMGYEHLYAPDLERDYSSPLLDFMLRDCLVRINRGLLKKYDYPPEDYDFAISIVISQCELWTDNADNPVTGIGEKHKKIIYKYPTEEHFDIAAEPNHYMKNE